MLDPQFERIGVGYAGLPDGMRRLIQTPAGSGFRLAISKLRSAFPKSGPSSARRHALRKILMPMSPLYALTLRYNKRIDLFKSLGPLFVGQGSAL
jgi:hypothetical protein